MRPLPSFLHRASRARESRHRRTILVAIAMLLLLSLTPVIGRHLLFSAHAPLTGIDHVGALCLVALHVLLGPVHEGLHLLVALGAAYAVWDRGRAWRRASRTLAPLHVSTPRPDDPFWTASLAAGLPPHRLRIVDELPVPAFTTGWWSPCVYVARDLVTGARRLQPDEMTALLAHERAHVDRRDPLRFSVLRAGASMLFWIPALRGLADDVADEAEVRADDVAAAVTTPLTVASAIVALAGWNAMAGSAAGWADTVPGSVGFVRADLVERRVRRLAGEDITPASRVTRRSVAGALLALAVVWTAGIVDVHALPHAGNSHGVESAHCEHAGGNPFAHLFCRRGASAGWVTPGGSDCPHDAA